MSQGSRPNYAATIAAALAREQAAYTTLYDIVLIMAKYKIAGDRGLAPEAPWLIHDATAHVLLHLHQCQHPAKFTSWAFRVIEHYYARAYRHLRRRKNRMLASAEVIGELRNEDMQQTICPRRGIQQLEAHIDATYTLARLPVSVSRCAVGFTMYGRPQQPRSTMTYVRKLVRSGEYLNRPVNEAFRLPGMVM